MGKPSAPDPSATAAAQTSSNLATATANANLNRIDQTSALGSSTYQVTGTNPDGTPKYTQTTSMSAPIQGIFNSQVANQQQAQNISSNLLGNVASQYSKPVDTSGVNPLNSGMSAADLAKLNSQYATSAGPAATSAGATSQLGNYVTGVGNGGQQIQQNLGSMSNIPGVISGAQNAAYANQMAYLTPQFQNDQSDMTSKLAAQGITQGSAAWDRAQSEMSRNQTFQQQQAQNSAFNQGISAGNTAFGMSLQSGQFTNQAQQQGFDQAISNAGLANHAADAATQNNQFNATLGTQNNQFNAGQTNAQSQYNAGLNNGAVSSQFGNATTNANVNNAAHAQGMTDTFSTYNQPLNTYNQLQSGAQAQQPTFASVPTANVAPTDVAGIINNGYANQVGAYNGTMQGLGQLGSAAIMYSDERLKENVEKVGQTPGGSNLYSYNYKGDGKAQIGVLAQELRKKQPDAVMKTPSGFLAVDYSKVK